MRLSICFFIWLAAAEGCTFPFDKHHLQRQIEAGSGVVLDRLNPSQVGPQRYLCINGHFIPRFFIEFFFYFIVIIFGQHILKMINMMVLLEKI